MFPVRFRAVCIAASAAGAAFMCGCVSQPMWPESYPDGVEAVVKSSSSLRAVFVPAWDGRLLAFGPCDGRNLLWNPIHLDAAESGFPGPGGELTCVTVKDGEGRFDPFDPGLAVRATGVRYETLADFGRALSMLSPRGSVPSEVRVGRNAVLAGNSLLIDETVYAPDGCPPPRSASVLFLRDTSRIEVRLRQGAGFDGLGNLKGRWTRDGDALDIRLFDPPEGARLDFDAETIAACYPEGRLFVSVSPADGGTASVVFGGAEERGGGRTRCVAFVFPVSGSGEKRLSLGFEPREINAPPEDDLLF